SRGRAGPSASGYGFASLPSLLCRLGERGGGRVVGCRGGGAGGPGGGGGFGGGGGGGGGGGAGGGGGGAGAGGGGGGGGGGGAPGRGGCPARAAAAAWAWMLWAATVQATVPSSARPTEPPSCWPVLSRLEATPESASGTRFSATRDSVTNSRAVPAPMTMVGPSTPLV